MKRLCLFLIVLVLSACEGETVYNPNDHPCPEWQIQVSTMQKVRLLNSNGSWINSIDYNKISMISTDQNWNPLFTESGIPIRDLGNIISVKPVFDNNNVINYLSLGLGQVKIEKRCFFLLQINENEYHRIIADYNIDCGNMILENFSYNGTEYIASDWSVIDIMVE